MVSHRVPPAGAGHLALRVPPFVLATLAGIFTRTRTTAALAGMFAPSPLMDMHIVLLASARSIALRDKQCVEMLVQACIRILTTAAAVGMFVSSPLVDMRSALLASAPRSANRAMASAGAPVCTSPETVTTAAAADTFVRTLRLNAIPIHVVRSTLRLATTLVREPDTAAITHVSEFSVS